MRIVGDSAAYERSLQRSSKATQSFGSKIRGMGKVAAFSAGAAGIGALALGLKESIDAFEEHDKVVKQTNQALKTTGGASKMTAKSIEELANKIRDKTGIDDESVQAVENQLLAFRNIREEAGRGNAVFSRATQVIEDYAVRTGKSAAGAAVAFGKALEDPVGKLGALARAGVVFTDKQKDAIKAMVKSGDLMGAQKLILSELEKRYGGAAAAAGDTFGGKLNILKSKLGDVAEQIGAKLVPALTRVLDWVLKNWPQISQAFDDALQTIKGVFNFIRPILEAFMRQIQGVVQLVTGLLSGDWSKAWEGLKNIVGGAFDGIKAQITAAISVIGPAAASLGSAIVNAIAGGITSAAQSVLDAITGLGSLVAGLASGAWSNVATVGTRFANVIGAGVTAAAASVTDAVVAFGGKIGALAGRAWDAVTALGRALTGKIAGGLAAAWTTIESAVVAFGGKIGGLAGRAWDAVVTLGRSLTGKVASGITAAIGAITDAVVGLGRAIGNMAGRAWSEVVGLGRSLGNKILDGLRAVVDAIKIPGFHLTLPYPTISIDWGSFAGVPYPKGINVGIGHTGFDIPGFDPIPSFAAGGMVGTAGAVPIVAHAGEFVINAEAAKKLGVPLLNYLNAYQGGGGVGGGMFGGGVGSGVGAGIAGTVAGSPTSTSLTVNLDFATTMAQAAQRGIDTVVGMFNAAGARGGSMFNAGMQMVAALAAGLIEAIPQAVDAAATLVAAVAKVANITATVAVTVELSDEQIKAMATGGSVPGRGGVPILAHGGEYVVSAKAARQLGPRALAMINRGKLPMFASGGQVGPEPSTGDYTNSRDFQSAYTKWFEGPLNIRGYSLPALLSWGAFMAMPDALRQVTALRGQLEQYQMEFKEGDLTGANPGWQRELWRIRNIGLNFPDVAVRDPGLIADLTQQQVDREGPLKSTGQGMRYPGAAFAAGGIVTRPTIGLLGEAGPEAVIPLGRGGPLQPIHVTVDLDGRTIGRVVTQAQVRGKTRRTLTGPWA